MALWLNMWATLVNRDGIVCAVAFTGVSRGDQWPGSRVISAQKPIRRTHSSLPGWRCRRQIFTAPCKAAASSVCSTVNRQHRRGTEAVRAPTGRERPDEGGGSVASTCSAAARSHSAPKGLVGGIGVMAILSCADHNIAWRTRANLGLDHFAPTQTGGVSGECSVRTTSCMTSRHRPDKWRACRRLGPPCLQCCSQNYRGQPSSREIRDTRCRIRFDRHGESDPALMPGGPGAGEPDSR
jgi:hypothetical protein